MLASTLSRRLLIPLRGCESRLSAALIKKDNVAPYPIIKNLSTPTARLFSSNDDLPDHTVVGMPALSPTMESGAIASWSVEVGEMFGAGDTLAEIETDKATITYDAQDDGCVAKFLVEAGTSDIKIGFPIMITVEEEESVAAFKDYVPPEATAEDTPPPAAVVPPPPTKVEATPSPPVVAAAPSTPELAISSPSPPQPSPVPATVVATTMTPVWGEPVKVSSPLVGRLSEMQKKYVELYGSTGQLPIE